MAAVPVTIVGILASDDGTSNNVTLTGMASITGLGVGGGPIQPPVGIWPPPGGPVFPAHPIAPGGPPPIAGWTPPGYHPAHPIAPGGPPQPPEGTEPPDGGWEWVFIPGSGWTPGYVPGDKPHPPQPPGGGETPPAPEGPTVEPH